MSGGVNMKHVVPMLTYFSYLCHVEKWETLPKALFECSQSPNAAHRESAFRIFATVPELISDQHVDALKSVFLTSLTDAESQEVSARPSNITFTNFIS